MTYVSTGQTRARNPFAMENARTLSVEELTSTFVPTPKFRQLFAPIHHVVLGARGSGKTAFARMLSHDHLSRLDAAFAKELVRDQTYIGMYVPMKVGLVGALGNKPWQSEAEKEHFFQWRLNVATCQAFLVTLNSCLAAYIGDRSISASIERNVAARLASVWAIGANQFSRLDDARQFIDDVYFRRLEQHVRMRYLGHLRPDEEPAGSVFEMELFAPLMRGIEAAIAVLGLNPQALWLLALDEAEFLDETHHRILNSYMRAHSDNLIFKLTTTPYHHYGLKTNTGAWLEPDQDFRYLYIDEDPVTLEEPLGRDRGVQFAMTLFDKCRRQDPRYAGITMGRLLGTSELLDPKSADWTQDSELSRALAEYGSPELLDRAERLRQTRRFKSEISRKIHGALLLRRAVAEQSGREELTLYSGVSLVVRCADGNPRRLLRILNTMLLELPSEGERSGDNPLLARTLQTRVLTTISYNTLTRVQSDPGAGLTLYEFLVSVGAYMRRYFHFRPLATDQVSSIDLDQSTPPVIWALVKRAVELGLLYPNVKASNPDWMPEERGTFHLAYVLAPYFRLLPRRGTSRDVASVIGSAKSESLARAGESIGLQQLLLPAKENP